MADKFACGRPLIAAYLRPCLACWRALANSLYFNTAGVRLRPLRPYSEFPLEGAR
jgi:hypothetical protein